MSSEAITRNDLTNILNEVLPPTPSEYRKLLWTNPSPTSAFSAQTISLDLSDYDEIEMLYAGKTIYVDTTVDSWRFVVGKGGLLNMSANEIWWRYVTPTTSGIEFGTGYRTPSYGANGVSDNTLIIPLNVYGIKYERVAPPQVDASDYVIEQGTSGIWTYRKWNSGIAECWGRTSISGLTTSVNLPFTFANNSYETQVTLINNSNTATNVTAISSFTDRVSIGVNTVPSGGARLFIIGRWK